MKIDIVFDGPPGHKAGRFVEVEDADGKSIKVGKWIDRGDGYWALRLDYDPQIDQLTKALSVGRPTTVDEAIEALERAGHSMDDIKIVRTKNSGGLTELIKKHRGQIGQ
jgi:hypothetical protein